MELETSQNKLLSQTTLERLLRRESILKITKTLKIVFIAGWFVVITCGVKYSFENWILSEIAIAEMKNQVVANISNIKKTKKIEKKEIDFEKMVKQGIFGTFIPPITPRPTPTPVTSNDDPRNPVILELRGTFIWGDAPSAALIANKKQPNSEDIFEINSRLFDVATLLAIYPDKVQISRAGEKQFLYLDNASSPTSENTQNNENSITVDEKELNNALSNLPLLLQQARAVPYFKNGKSIGLRLFAIRPGSLYEKIGLQNGDILKKINSTDLSDISQAIKLFEKLKQEKNVTVVLERQREDKTLNYVIR